MEFSLDESYDEDYSAVEDMICNEMEKGSPEYIKRKIFLMLQELQEKLE